MSITPLVAAAIPAGIAAVKLTQHAIENRPFRNLLTQTDETVSAPGNDGETQLKDFRQQVQKTLAASGIDTRLSFNISSDSDGNLRIGDNHPRQKEIEQILNGNDEVVAAFHRLAAATQLRNAAEAHLAFAEQYVRDPSSTALPPASGTQTFTVRINGDEIQVN